MISMTNSLRKVLIGSGIAFGLVAFIFIVIAMSSRVSDPSYTNVGWVAPLIFAVLFSFLSGVSLVIVYLTK